MFPRHASLHPTGETVDTHRTIAGVEAELSEGQDWSDMIAVTMTREQWTMAIVCLMTQAHELKEGVESALRAAREGELTATLMIPHLMESNRLMASIIKAATETVYPEIAAEAEAHFQKHREEAIKNSDA